MKKNILHPLVTALMLIVISSCSLDARSQKVQLYVSGTVSANENMLVTVRGTNTIQGNVVIAEMNGKKTEKRIDKNGRAIIDFSAIATGIIAPAVAVIKTFDKKGNLTGTANTTVQPRIVQTTTAPVMVNLPANLANSDVVKITGRNLGADAKLVCGNKTQQTLSASDMEMTVFTNSKTGEQPLYVSTANGVSQSQMVNIYNLDFNLPKSSISPAEKVQAMVHYESIPAGTKFIFTNSSPETIKMNIPGAVNTANECIYTVADKNGTIPVNITGLTKGDFTIALDFNFSNEPFINKTGMGGMLTNYASDDAIDYDKITKRDQLPKLIIPGYDKYSAARLIDKKSHEDAMKDAFESEDAQKRWNDVFKRIYNGK
jgi:hypothetical protein